jgi:transcriptional regulator with XRE-family HTH domain
MAKDEKSLFLQVFGESVRKRRKNLGFSQEAFADHCEIDRSYMGGVERGERNIALLNIMRILEGLDVKPSEFFKDLNPEKVHDWQTTKTAEKERGQLRKIAGLNQPAKSSEKVTPKGNRAKHL